MIGHWLYVDIVYVENNNICVCGHCVYVDILCVYTLCICTYCVYMNTCEYGYCVNVDIVYYVDFSENVEILYLWTLFS